MSSAHKMLAFVMGQFCIMPLATYLIKSTVLGRPLMSCKEDANTKSEYSLTVYLDLLSVLINMFPCHF